MPSPRFARLYLVLAVVALGVSCRRREIAAGVSDSAFVTVMAALRRLPAASMVDSASRTRARDSILRFYGTTPEALEQVANVLASEPERAAFLWQAVERKQSEPRK